MVDRINLLLKAKNVTARQFAEEIGIQPSGMSHILSGRNNPSLDFVMKVIKRWPEVNINWLMFGMGEMYASVPLNAPERKNRDAEAPVSKGEAEQFDLFSSQEGREVAPTVSDKQPSEVAPVQQPTPSAAKAVTPKVESPIMPTSEAKSTSSPMPAQKEQVVHEGQSTDNSTEAPILVSDPSQPMPKKKKVVKMIVMYDDHSFAEYYPE